MNIKFFLSGLTFRFETMEFSPIKTYVFGKAQYFQRVQEKGNVIDPFSCKFHYFELFEKLILNFMKNGKVLFKHWNQIDLIPYTSSDPYQTT